MQLPAQSEKERKIDRERKKVAVRAGEKEEKIHRKKFCKWRSSNNKAKRKKTDKKKKQTRRGNKFALNNFRNKDEK